MTLKWKRYQEWWRVFCGAMCVCVCIINFIIIILIKWKMPLKKRRKKKKTQKYNYYNRSSSWANRSIKRQVKCFGEWWDHRLLDLIITRQNVLIFSIVSIFFLYIILNYYFFNCQAMLNGEKLIEKYEKIKSTLIWFENNSF